MHTSKHSESPVMSQGMEKPYSVALIQGNRDVGRKGLVKTENFEWRKGCDITDHIHKRDTVYIAAVCTCGYTTLSFAIFSIMGCTLSNFCIQLA